MHVAATTDAPADTGADTVVVGVFEGEDVAHDLPGGELQALLDSGEARRGFRRLAATHAGGRRWILAGLGERGAFDAERARVAAAVAHGRAREMSARHVCWEVPHHVGDDVVQALVEGTVLAGYRYTAFKSEGADRDGRVESLTVSAHHDVGEAAGVGAAVGAAANAARDLQNAPANHMTPAHLAERARELARETGMACEVLGREQIRAAGMGAFAAVAQGSAQDPALITLRYDGAGASGPVLGFVGKAVTFDSGGISIKPGRGMGEMKFDMSGGAAVLEAAGAIARLRLPVALVAVVGAAENMPSGTAVKPGDIVRAKTGTTIEVLNTDAEGRLVLADCLAHAIECGAQRLVDVATLTGGVVTALGTVYAGLLSNDDEWCEAVRAAGEAAGEPVWRLPLHPDYAKALEGRYADLQNVNEDRRATTILGGEFLHRFVGDVPWAHVDIAGVAWDRKKEYAPKGGNAFGLRLLVQLARNAAR